MYFATLGWLIAASTPSPLELGPQQSYGSRQLSCSAGEAGGQPLTGIVSYSAGEDFLRYRFEGVRGSSHAALVVRRLDKGHVTYTARTADNRVDRTWYNAHTSRASGGSRVEIVFVFEAIRTGARWCAVPIDE